MQWLNKQVRPEILKLAPYVSARSELADSSGLVALDANENPWVPYPQTAEMSLVNRYPDPQPIGLLSRMANFYGVKTEQVFVGRGMDEGIELLIRVFCTAYKDNIVTFKPTFSYYKVAADIQGIETRELELGSAPDFKLDIDKMLGLCDNNTKIIFLCTPNNPTGSSMSLAEIEYILKAKPEIVLAVDEAYLEFSKYQSAIALMDKYDNLVVMKTMSKAFAFAGVRLGSILAQKPIIELICKVMAPYPLAEPCIRVALQTMSAHGLQLAKSRIDILISERDRVFAELSKLHDIIVYSSDANFLLIQVNDANKIYKDLLGKGIIVRNRHRDIPNTLRITIGSPIENDLLLAAFGCGNNVAKVERTSTVVRNTNETKILVEINLDKTSPIKISTGIGFFDHMLDQLAKHGGFSMNLQAIGDTHIDYHHTVEDVAIALGNALRQALGDKRGINRYGFAVPMDESLASCNLDLSGRGVLQFDAKFPTPMIGDFPVEMVEHFFLSLSDSLQAAIHLKATGENSHHMVEGLFKACAKALNQAIKQTSDVLPSTKGIL
ncbi:MAG: histidinol-phosphate transaminase [Burkholderiales bacterium]|nr:histidinol-phosphate transaminase [Burkholderiales bacterium]